MTGLADEERSAPSFFDGCKRVLLGKPMITDDLQHEKLSNPVALGALSPDAISSTAYGPEQIMVELLPAAGMAAFVLLLPLIGVILLILVLVTASYRQVVMAYTRAGGSYIVARENFGPRVAQIAAAALLIDYVVTVAIQCAAGTVAVVVRDTGAGPLQPGNLGRCGADLLLCNLRGLREAGRTFAVPTYWFIGMLTLMIVVGVVREMFGNLPQYDPQHLDGAVPVHQGNGLVMGATILVILRAFANGGSSLTGVEAISNTVNLFRKPEGLNARRVLTIMATVLGLLLAGVAWLGYATHSRLRIPPDIPSMLSEIGRAVFGNGLIGNVMFFSAAGGERGDSVQRCQYQLQRFSGADSLCCRGQLPAAAADEARSSAGVLQCHHPADRAGGGALGRHRRLGQRAGADVRDGRVHRASRWPATA